MLRAVANQAPGFVFLGTYTQAALPAASAGNSGAMALVSNLGAAPGTYVISNGSRWKVLSGSAMLKGLGDGVSSITNVESLPLQTLLPANSWQVNDTLRFFLTLGKSGTTDTLTGSVYIGPLGTALDPAIVSNQVWITAANVGAGLIFDIKLISATSAQRLGMGPAAGLGTYTGGSSTAQSSAVVIDSAAATALYVTVGIKSSSTNNTVSMQSGQIQLITP